jgi:hypothetical protein
MADSYNEQLAALQKHQGAIREQERAKDAGRPIPPKPVPDYVEVFNQSARLIDGLPMLERGRVIHALALLFGAKL